jgi:hypothetical protein
MRYINEGPDGCIAQEGIGLFIPGHHRSSTWYRTKISYGYSRILMVFPGNRCNKGRIKKNLRLPVFQGNNIFYTDQFPDRRTLFADNHVRTVIRAVTKSREYAG